MHGIKSDAGLSALSRNNNFLSKNYEFLREKYGGKHIAITGDKENIIAGDTVAEVMKEIEKRDIDFEEVTIEYIPKAGEVVLF